MFYYFVAMQSYRFPLQNVIFVVVLGLFSLSSARKVEPLDTAAIHSAFINGDFDQATTPLESALQSKRAMSHADSVFTYKHLGVIYAAAAATREKGRFYLYQIVSLDPNANILDMYASDNIFLIFRNVQEDYKSKQAGIESANGTRKRSDANSSRVSPTVLWVTGGAAITMATALFLYGANEKPKSNHSLILVRE